MDSVNTQAGCRIIGQNCFFKGGAPLQCGCRRCCLVADLSARMRGRLSAVHLEPGRHDQQPLRIALIDFHLRAT
jgi:hypothetical protein